MNLMCVTWTEISLAISSIALVIAALVYLTAPNQNGEQTIIPIVKAPFRDTVPHDKK